MHIDIPWRYARGCYGLHYYWREFNLAIFYDLSNCQIKVIAKFSRYTVYINKYKLRYLSLLCVLCKEPPSEARAHTKQG